MARRKTAAFCIHDRCSSARKPVPQCKALQRQSDGAVGHGPNVYLIPVLGNAWIGDLDLPELNAAIRHLTLLDGTPASGSTKGTVASVLRRLFAWAREEWIIRVNPALELRTGWGGSVRRRVVIPSVPQVLRLAEALGHFKPRRRRHRPGLYRSAMGGSRGRARRQREPCRAEHDHRPDCQRVRRPP
jgi:hypothetical protein